MAPDSVTLEPIELAKVRRAMMVRWMQGGLSLREWDEMSYAEQCELIEIKRAYDTNSEYDYNVRRTR